MWVEGRAGLPVRVGRGTRSNAPAGLNAETQTFVLLRSWERRTQGPEGANKPGVCRQMSGSGKWGLRYSRYHSPARGNGVGIPGCRPGGGGA